MTIVNDMAKALLENPHIILLITIIVAVIVYVVTKGKKGIYEAALYLVSVAEEEWGSKTGQIKFAEVISTIKAEYPIISLFLREETLKRIIEDALAEMKVILENKKRLEDKAKFIEEATESLKQPFDTPTLETVDPTTAEPEPIKPE